ncbi:hypothetical protein L1987_53872 [Smallanthus sonchifolius]|uniref:Uncharacterized protein n=1 Tax=Smallanthus sonchifolius TaxID=185202 RepID=A0ACB9EX19_9ASTR|nr:hypothetical protein L1987_53872 [Smallanthus sonchifolius]
MDPLYKWRTLGNPPEKPPDLARTRGSLKESTTNWAGLIKTVDRINPIRISRAVGQVLDPAGSNFVTRTSNLDPERFGSDIDPRNVDLERFGSDFDPHKVDLVPSADINDDIQILTPNTSVHVANSELEQLNRVDNTTNQDYNDVLVSDVAFDPTSTNFCADEVEDRDALSVASQVQNQGEDCLIHMMTDDIQVSMNDMQVENDDLKSGLMDCLYQNPMFTTEIDNSAGTVTSKMEDVNSDVDLIQERLNLGDLDLIHFSDDQIHEALIAYLSKSYSTPEFEHNVRKFITRNVMNPEFDLKFGNLFRSSAIGKCLRNCNPIQLHAPVTNSVSREVNDAGSTNLKKTGDIGEFNFYDVLSERTLVFMLKRKLLYREKVLSDLRNCSVDEDIASNPSIEKKFKPGAKKDKEGKTLNPKFFYVTPEGRTIIKLVNTKYKIPDAPLLTPLLNLEFNAGNDKVNEKLDFKGSVKAVKEQKVKLKKQNRVNLFKPRNVVQFCDKGKSILGAVPVVKDMVFKAKGVDTKPTIVANKVNMTSETKASYAGAVKGTEVAKVVNIRESIKFVPPTILASGEKVVIIKPKVLFEARKLYDKHLYGIRPISEAEKLARTKSPVIPKSPIKEQQGDGEMMDTDGFQVVGKKNKVLKKMGVGSISGGDNLKAKGKGSDIGGYKKNNNRMNMEWQPTRQSDLKGRQVSYGKQHESTMNVKPTGVSKPPSVSAFKLNDKVKSMNDNEASTSMNCPAQNYNTISSPKHSPKSSPVKMEYRPVVKNEPVLMEVSNSFHVLQDDLELDSPVLGNDKEEAAKKREKWAADHDPLCAKAIGALHSAKRIPFKAAAIPNDQMETMENVTIFDPEPPAGILPECQSMFDDHFDIISDKKKRDVMFFVSKKIMPTQKDVDQWCHIQSKYFFKMCEVYNFEEGLQYINLEDSEDDLDDESDEDSDVESEVESDTNEDAEFMKLDDATSTQGAQVLCSPSSPSKSS